MPFLLEGVALEKDYLQSDYKHPNALGVNIMASNLYPYILKGMSFIVNFLLEIFIYLFNDKALNLLAAHQV